MKILTLMVAGFTVVLVLAFAIIHSVQTSASQYGTDFKFKDLKAMEEDGWIINHSEGVSLRSDGIVLDGTKGLTSITYPVDIPNVLDWKAGARCSWLGGNGHSWLDVQVTTQRHGYTYALDGSKAQYLLLRDNVEVLVVDGYREAANSQVEIHLEKLGSTITLSFNNKVIKTYTEKDQSPVTSVHITSPSQSAALYSWAGAFIPEPSAAGPVGGSDTHTDPSDPIGEPEPVSNSDWLEYDPGEGLNIIPDQDNVTGIQSNPGSDFDFPTEDPDGQIPEPPLPLENETPSEDENPHLHPNIWIVMLDGTFSINTEQAQVDDTVSFVTGNCLFNGVGQAQNVYIGDGTAQVQAAILHEQHLFESGAIDPATPVENNLWGGDTPSFYVTGSTHISGDVNNPLTAQSAVAIFTFTVTDANGQVVYQNEIKAVASEGKTLYDYWLQGSNEVNAYLQSVINSMKNQ
jgi:hypothetical protein